ncbi:MAG: hypothetical protein DWI58_20595 [Chloroflexi bacterium]|nr:MAG: hypothetical protein DWI58_20595 [Chloroflexota bacterium]
MHPARVASIAVAVATLAAAVALIVPLAPRADAQTPPIPTPSGVPGTPPTPPARPPSLRDPNPGDIVWTLAQEFPFSDDRATLALAAYITPLVNTDASTGVLPAEPRHRVGVPPTDLTLLMEAAGLRSRGGTNLSALRAVGPCRFWVGEAPAGFTSTVSLAKTADAVADSFVRGVRDLLGITMNRCIPTANAADAHVLVWVQGTRPPANPERGNPTLIASQASPSATPSATTAAQPAPAKTGAGAPASDGLGVIDVAQGGVLTALLTAAGVVAARAVGRRPA